MISARSKAGKWLNQDFSSQSLSSADGSEPVLDVEPTLGRYGNILGKQTHSRYQYRCPNLLFFKELKGTQSRLFSFEDRRSDKK